MAAPSSGPQHPITVLFARQPIYDRKKALAGCELLFRPYNNGNELCEPFDGDSATQQVMLSAFTETSIRQVCEDTPAFINFTANTLELEIPFSPDDMIIEVLETVDISKEVIDSVQRFRSQGYRIALDDYSLKDTNHPLLPYVDIVKLDFQTYSREEFIHVVGRLKHDYAHVTLLAEKVETHDDFQLCVQAGCDLFQGYFLARPAAVKGQRMPHGRLTVLQLLAELNHSDISTRELTNIIQRDPFMSVRLMKMVNSPFYNRTRNIASLQMAITMLGQRRIRSLANMLALTQLSDKPHSLQKLALRRGYLCDALAEGIPEVAMSGFTVGLFSGLDAFFDQPLTSVLSEIPLHASLRQAILEHEGTLGKLLSTVLRLERGELDLIDWAGLTELGISAEKLSQAHQRAIILSNEQF